MALTVLDDVDHPVDKVGTRRVVADLPEICHRLVRIERIDALPCGEVEEIGDGQVALAVLRRGHVAQFRHDAGDAEQTVEIGAADMHAGIGEHVLAAVRPAPRLRRNAHDREVRRAAADIGDQRDLLALHRLLVVHGSRDRFELELDVVKTLLARRLLQLVLRRAVRRLVLVDEMHRASEHDMLHIGPMCGIEMRFEMAEHQPDNVGERHGARLDARFLVDQRGSEHAFQRPHQAPLGIQRVVLDGAAAEIGMPVLEIEEDGTWDRHRRALDGHESRRAVVDDPDGGVRRAEVDAAKGRFHDLVHCRGIFRGRAV